jgi:GTP-binding protein Era
MERDEKMRAGFVAVVGRPNAGKSTLLNHLVGEKLAMVSQKAQATRKRMNIIVMHGATQIIFIDTPGIHEKEKLLNQFMLEEALKAIGDADAILFLAPVTDGVDEYARFLERLGKKKTPHIVLLTKIDQVPQARVLARLGEYQKFQEHFDAIIPFTIKKGGSKRQLLDAIANLLPEHPWLFDSEMLTTDNIRDIYRELIREAIFENLSDEIPYESDVVIDRIEEGEHMDRVFATIVVEKPTQKGMMVGQRGETIRRVGTDARKIMEHFAEKKIYLDLHVSIKRGWSKNRAGLEELGYQF